jgi:hypothetical protein
LLPIRTTITFTTTNKVRQKSQTNLLTDSLIGLEVSKSQIRLKMKELTKDEVLKFDKRTALSALSEFRTT